jgi:purine-binding chemotaxis protein CheW
MQLEDETLPSYLIFKLAEELYGTALLSVKEVIKMSPIKPVPYMVHYFKGVINLRGEIVGIVDLRSKFEMGSAKSDGANETGKILIIETPDALLGAIVDDLVAVEVIQEKDIDPDPAVETRIPIQFFKGIAKKDDRLISLIDISSCLSSTEMRMTFQKGNVA